MIVILSASEVKIGVLAFRSKSDTLNEWKPTAEYLSRQIPGFHFQIIPMNYPELRESVAKESLDFVITNSGHYVYLEHLYGISRISTIMKYKNGRWLDRFGGVIFTRSDKTEIIDLSDLHDKTISAVDQDSLGGYSAPLFEVVRQGIDQKNLKFHFTGMPHDNVVNNVMEEKTDIGFVRTEVLEEMASENKIDLKQIKILNKQNIEEFPYTTSTPLYPEWPIARLRNTSIDLADQVVVALLGMKHELPAEGEKRWTAPLEYEMIHLMFRELKLPPYDAPPIFNLNDVYQKYKIAIFIIASLIIFIIIGAILQTALRRKYQIALDERIKTDLKLFRESQKNETILRMAGDGIHILTIDGILIEANEAFCRFLGYDKHELIGKHVSEWEKDFPLDKVLELYKEDKNASYLYETIHRSKDGRHVEVEMNITVIDILNEQRLYCSSRDITKRKESESQIKLMTMMHQYSNDAISITDSEGKIISVNPAFMKMTGYDSSEIIGNMPKHLKSGIHDHEFYETMWRELNMTGHWEGEITDRGKEGQLFTKWLSIRTIFNEHGEPYRRMATFTDKIDSKVAQHIIHHQANYDTLTGLPNRHFFFERLSVQLDFCKQQHTNLAVLLLDLDRFKEVNESLGHNSGDELIVMVAKRLEKVLKPSDLLARVGGDEFAILLFGQENSEYIDDVSKELIASLIDPFELNGQKLHLSASIGIAIAPDDGEDSETLLKHTDQAMYAAKELGRNRYTFFRTEMQENLLRKTSLINKMRRAIEENQFYLYYQPIKNLHDNKIQKAEALIRWIDNDGKLISPAEFIPLAEETGLIVDIGHWIIQEAAQQVLEWRKKYHPDFQISINLSPVQFQSERDDAVDLAGIMQKKGLQPNALVIEITEGLLMNNSEIVSSRLRSYQQTGIDIALDDFGTGYSSLSYLKKFDIDFIKIDQSFVMQLEKVNDDRILCEAIVSMSHKLGIQVIAEGVETLFQEHFMQEIGCDFIQGYLISKPLPYKEFEELFLK